MDISILITCKHAKETSIGSQSVSRSVSLKVSDNALLTPLKSLRSPPPPISGGIGTDAVVSLMMGITACSMARMVLTHSVCCRC